jgi:hypothetical protein
MEHNQMPLMRYFVFVGGALLALLFIVNASLPASPVAEVAHSIPATDHSVIRIHSDRKWPEPVVFDTSRPTIAPVPAPEPALAQADTAPAKAATAALKGGVREAYAQLPTNSARPAPKRQRKSLARNNAEQQRIRLAQQPSVALFGNNSW